MSSHSDLVISWGADLAATNVHFWALAEEQRKKRGVPIVVIDPRRTRSAKAADLYLPIRIGTDAALALGIMHILVRDKLATATTSPSTRWASTRSSARSCRSSRRQRVAEITGLAVADIEKLAAMYGKAKAALIRLGEGMTRLTHGGQALRTVALLPGVSGHYGREGRRRPAADRGLAAISTTPPCASPRGRPRRATSTTCAWAKSF